MRAIISIAVLVIGGAIVADLISHPTGTNNIITGLTNLWTTAVKGASGSYTTPGS